MDWYSTWSGPYCWPHFSLPSGSSILLDDIENFFAKYNFVVKHYIENRQSLGRIRINCYQELPKYLRGYHAVGRQQVVELAAILLRARTCDDRAAPLSQLTQIISEIVPRDMIKIYSGTDWKKVKLPFEVSKVIFVQITSFTLLIWTYQSFTKNIVITPNAGRCATIVMFVLGVIIPFFTTISTSCYYSLSPN